MLHAAGALRDQQTAEATPLTRAVGCPCPLLAASGSGEMAGEEIAAAIKAKGDEIRAKKSK